MKDSNIFTRLGTAQLLTLVAMLFAVNFSVSHCTQQAGIDRTVVASETAERNTGFISEAQITESNERKAIRLADSITILAQSELIGELKKSVDRKVTYDSVAARKQAELILSEIIESKQLTQSSLNALLTVFDAEKFATEKDTVFIPIVKTVTDTIFKSDTIYVKEVRPFSMGKFRRESVKKRKVKHAKVRHKVAKIHKTQRAKNGGI